MSYVPPSGSAPAGIREPLRRDAADMRRGTDPMYSAKPAAQHKAAAVASSTLPGIPETPSAIPSSPGFVNAPQRPIPQTVSSPAGFNQAPIRTSPGAMQTANNPLSSPPAPQVRETLNKGAAADPLRQASGALQQAGYTVVANPQLTAKQMPTVYSKPAASGGLNPNKIYP